MSIGLRANFNNSDYDSDRWGMDLTEFAVHAMGYPPASQKRAPGMEPTRVHTGDISSLRGQCYEDNLLGAHWLLMVDTEIT